MTKIKNNKLLILGCGGHAKVITDIARSQGIKDFSYQDINIEIKTFLGKDVIHEEIKNYNGYFFVALGDNFLREKVTNDFQKANPNAKNATLVHPTSHISKNCTIGVGTVVMPMCVINSSSKIGNGVIINTKSSLDHDNYLMNYSSCAPGVVTGGNVFIGDRSAVAIGVIIKHDIKIGSDTVIGAASYVNKNIPANCLAYGTPVKVIKKRESNEKYL